jgi:hypothetical protein
MRIRNNSQGTPYVYQVQSTNITNTMKHFLKIVLLSYAVFHDAPQAV